MMVTATVDQVVVDRYHVVAGAGTAVTTAVILLFEKDMIQLKFARLVKYNTHFPTFSSTLQTFCPQYYD